MTYSDVTQVSFLAGELSPKTRGRYDLQFYSRGAEQVKNFLIELQGSVRYREGFKLAHTTRLNNTAVLIPFQFNDTQAYVIEVTDTHFRFYKDDAIILNSSQSLTDITNASPGVVTKTSHGYLNGTEVLIEGVVGMEEVNGRYFIVANKTDDTFELQDIFGNVIDTTNYGVYSSGGTMASVYVIFTSYVEADMADVQYAQNADTMYLVHREYAPNKLTRTGHTSWTIGTFSRTNDPFGSNNYPGSVKFYEGRLWYGGTNTKPQSFWGSRAPSTSGATQYDDFTLGAPAPATDAVYFTMAQNSGQQDLIQWMSGTDKYLFFGTFGGVSRVYGATPDEAITPTGITVKPVSPFGADRAMPFSDNKDIFFIRRGGKGLLSVQYDFISENYSPYDRMEVAEHLAKEYGLTQIAFQSGKPEAVWAVREDGALLCLTYKSGSVEPGWSKHIVGGIDGKVLSVCCIGRPSQDAQLWIVVERTVNGNTVRTVEVLTDEIIYPDYSEFYTGQDNKEADMLRYLNALYEKQKDGVYLDSALSYDGTLYGTDADAALTPDSDCTTAGATGVTFTADNAVFTSDMVGREIWKKYDETGVGGGRALITSYTDSTHVDCTIKVGFNNDDEIAAGDWYLTATELSGLWHLEGEEVHAVTDGSYDGTYTVSGGAITVSNPTSKAHVGFTYQGFMKTNNLEFGSIGGTSQGLKRNIAEVFVKLLNSLGIKIGTNLYDLDQMEFRTTANLTNRPTPLFSGVKRVPMDDGWNEQKFIYVVQDYPLPCNIQGIDLHAETEIG